MTQQRRGSTGDSRGQSASSPAGIPARGWKDILVRVGGEISRDRVMLIAAGVTFYLLLAMVPAMSAFISIYGLFSDPATVQQQLQMLEGFVPGGGMAILDEQLSRLAGQANTTLGATLAISLAIALWSTNAGVKALFEAMNVAYGEQEQRSFIKLTAISLLFTLAAIVAGVVGLGVIVLLPTVLQFLGLGQGAEWLIRLGSYALLAVMALLGLAALYRWGPCRADAKWRWITPGAVLTVVVTLVASVLFSWYVANFGSYNETYGSLGALIGFMTWIWITSTIVIVGAELNSEMEHQTAHDTTTEPAMPMGRRGARMADQVAAGSTDSRNVAADRRAPSGSRHEGTMPLRSGWSPALFAVGIPLLLLLRRSKRSRVEHLPSTAERD